MPIDPQETRQDPHARVADGISPLQQKKDVDTFDSLSSYRRSKVFNEVLLMIETRTSAVFSFNRRSANVKFSKF